MNIPKQISFEEHYVLVQYYQNKIKKLQTNLTSIGAQFGQIKIAKMKLEDQEIVLKEQLSLLTKEENSIAKAFTDKYGRGSLDVETGEFTPTE